MNSLEEQIVINTIAEIGDVLAGDSNLTNSEKTLKSISAGNNVKFEDNNNEIIISADGDVVTGESNLTNSENVLKSLIAGNNISINSSNEQILISAVDDVVAAASNLTKNRELSSLIAGEGLSLDYNGANNTYTINFTSPIQPTMYNVTELAYNHGIQQAIYVYLTPETGSILLYWDRKAPSFAIHNSSPLNSCVITLSSSSSGVMFYPFVIFIENEHQYSSLGWTVNGRELPLDFTHWYENLRVEYENFGYQKYRLKMTVIKHVDDTWETMYTGVISGQLIIDHIWKTVELTFSF